MHSFWQDLRYAARGLWKNPGFTAIIVLTIALGVGANTTMFSLVRGFTRPLPVPEPDRITAIFAQSRNDELGIQYRMSFPAFLTLASQARSFDSVFACMPWMGGLTADQKTEEFVFSYVTGNYFSGLGLRPAAGRLFEGGEGLRKSPDPLLVLGYSYWQKRFGGDRGAIGKRVELDGRPMTIIGVAPRGFHGVGVPEDEQGYLPLNNASLLPDYAVNTYKTLFENRELRTLTVLGRLKSGVSLRTAQVALDVLGRRMALAEPATEKDISYHILPETLARPVPMPRLAKAIPTIAGLFLILALLVLMLATVNMANLLLVRGTVREREMAIRSALGSGRARLVRQMLTESMLLAMCGGVAGLALAAWASDGIGSIRMETSAPALPASFDGKVFLYALASTLLTGLLAGLWPALRGSRSNVRMILHAGGRSDSAGVSRQRVRSALVVAQVAGSLMLLIVAGLFVRNLQRSQRMELGFDPDHLLVASMDTRYVGRDRVRTEQFYRELRRRVGGLPGVQSASLSFSMPMTVFDDASAVYPEGRPIVPGEKPLWAPMNRVSPEYFAAMRVRVLRGRAFRTSDDENAPRVAIVNEALANRLWPNQDPIGKRFATRPGEAPLEVIGLTPTGKYIFIFEPSLPCFYIPMAQSYTSRRWLEVRSALPPDVLGRLVEREVRALDPDLPIAEMRSGRQVLAGAQGFLWYRLGASIAGCMGLLGLALAVVGVYGVVSYGASQRTREIGIRMALGAGAGDVRRLILSQGVRLVAAGIGLGVVAAVVLTRMVASFLQRVTATDPLTFAGVTLLLGTIALAACYVPAWRALRVDPMVALRHE